MKSITEQIFSYAKYSPDKTAVFDGKRSFSYSELARNILFAKNVLVNECKLRKGDCVILASAKGLEFVCVYFACHLCGAIALPIDPETNEKRLSVICSKANPKLVVGLSKQTECKTIPYDKLVKNETDSSELLLDDILFPDSENIADIIFTTGTTGDPKGVTLTQKNISAAALNINTFIKNTSEDVELLALPVSHSFGLGRMRCALSNGQTLILLGSFANMKRFFRYIEEFKVTGFGMVPASWAMIKKLSGKKIADFAKQLKYIEIGSAPMLIEDKQLLCTLLPDTRICMHYGLTEASRSAFIEFHSQNNMLETVGKETPNMRVSICDEKGNMLPVNTEGEICVEGDAVTNGYYQEKEITAESFWGKKFRTGDWGQLDNYGYLTLKSRKKELINVGGKKVSPIEVEDVLRSFDFVKDCACIAIPDPNGVLGEVVKAFVVTDEPEKLTIENMTGLIGNQLETYKLPIQYEAIGAIPKTSSGKIQRLMLMK